MEKRARLTSISSHLPISSQMRGDVPDEPEDARLTGGTRSLSRRLLGLNLGTADETF